MRSRLDRVRRWLTLPGVVAAAGVLLPPAGSAARHYVLAQAVQFAVLAVAVPALLVLGAPWRLRPAGQRLADRAAIARSHRPGSIRPRLSLVGCIAMVIAWRLPVVVNALVRYPILTLVEAVTLIAAGGALWLELVESPPLLPTMSRPLRALFAALPMWTIWAIAYIMGFSHTVWFTALAHAPGHGIGTIADQEIAAFLLWLIPGLCFVPVVFVSLITWLRDNADPDAGLREVPAAGAGPGLAMPRPPRGWRAPSL